MEQWLESSPGEALENNPTLFDYYATNVTSHICFVSNINALFKAWRSLACDQLKNKAGNLERHLPTYEEWVKHVSPEDVCHLGETLLDQLEAWGIPCKDNQKLVKFMTIF